MARYEHDKDGKPYILSSWADETPESMAAWERAFRQERTARLQEQAARKQAEAADKFLEWAKLQQAPKSGEPPRIAEPPAAPAAAALAPAPVADLRRQEHKRGGLRWTPAELTTLQQVYRDYRQAHPRATKSEIDRHLAKLSLDRFKKPAHPDTVRDHIRKPVDLESSESLESKPSKLISSSHKPSTSRQLQTPTTTDPNRNSQKRRAPHP
jgi:hypothetical protein